MSAVNPFGASNIELGNLTPRRREYIKQRNIAQDERVNDIAEAIIQYQKIIGSIRDRYKKSEPEEQNLIRPYLTNLYFEIGQLFEEKEQAHDALVFYEQAGMQGHSVAVECAKRLGSKKLFIQPEEGIPREMSSNELLSCRALHEALVLISSENGKGSGILSRHDSLGYILVTVEHVRSPGATAYLGGKQISLDNLNFHKNGSDILLFDLNNVVAKEETVFPLAPANIHLEIGEKVYFGGYPFKETGARLHMGHISYIGKGAIGIDGVAVSGMSGGPIAVERNERLFLIGAIASETFDPIEGFSKALGRMYMDQADAEARYEHTRSLQHESWEWMKKSSQFTKITRDQFTIGVMDRSKTIELELLKDEDPEIFKKMWDDLNRTGVISIEGEIDEAKIVPGQLGLREEFQQYEEDVLNRLRKSTTDLKEMDPETIQLASKTEKPTDSMNTVGLSLVQSLSTGLITCHLFQELYDQPLSSRAEEATEFEIGRKNRDEKAKKKIINQAYRERAAAKKDGTFRNAGLPRVLYRFVSKEAAKDIKKNGIRHLGGDLDEIHFMTKPESSMAKSVGAMSTDKMITVYTDRIPNITKDNVRMVAERNHIGTYRINISIPPEALEIA